MSAAAEGGEAEGQERGGEEEELDEEAVAAALGFGGFGSTKGVAVADNRVGPARGGAKVIPVRKYRQYMNRVGGFAHALDAQKPSSRH